MAVCWRCPSCSEVSCEDDVNVTGNPVACDHCERPFPQQETLCTVCDAPNPWTRRDTLHFLCRECGTAQTYFSHLPMAVSFQRAGRFRGVDVCGSGESSVRRNNRGAINVASSS